MKTQSASPEAILLSCLRLFTEARALPLCASLPKRRMGGLPVLRKDTAQVRTRRFGVRLPLLRCCAPLPPATQRKLPDPAMLHMAHAANARLLPPVGAPAIAAVGSASDVMVHDRQDRCQILIGQLRGGERLHQPVIQADPVAHDAIPLTRDPRFSPIPFQPVYFLDRRRADRSPA